jgi:xanthine dehydrogenase accessory factor
MAAEIHAGDIAGTLDGIDVDGRTYVVLVSRGHQQDETALRHAIGRGAAYVGMIGSRRRTGTVLNRLAADGLSAEALDAVHTPIGLDIGAETPEEIAVSILAEIVMERRGGSGRPMRAARGRAASPDRPPGF